MCARRTRSNVPTSAPSLSNTFDDNGLGARKSEEFMAIVGLLYETDVSLPADDSRDVIIGKTIAQAVASTETTELMGPEIQHNDFLTGLLSISCLLDV